MKNILLLLLTAVITAIPMILSSCADNDKEEVWETGKSYNYFEVPADDKTPEGELRRNFYKDFDSYLFFDDLIYSGPDKITGEHLELRLNIDWRLTSALTERYTIEQYTDYDDMKDACEFVEKHIYGRLAGVKNARPFSTLLAKRIYIDDYGKLRFQNYVMTFRSLALSVDLLKDLDETKLKNDVSLILYNYLNMVMPKYTDKAWQTFYSYCDDELFGVRIKEIFPDYNKGGDRTPFYEMGYLVFNDGYYPQFYSKADELKNFITEMFKYTRVEFEEQFGEYKIIMDKYNAIRNVVEPMGFKF